MIFVESSRDACLSFDECYEICFRQNCTFSFALFVHFHLTFTCKFIEPYVDSDDYNKLRSKIYKKTRYYAVYQNKYFDKMKEVLDVIFKGIREPRVCYCQKRLKDLKKQFISLELSSQMQRYIKINFKRRFPVQAFAWTLI